MHKEHSCSSIYIVPKKYVNKTICYGDGYTPDNNTYFESIFNITS